MKSESRVVQLFKSCQIAIKMKGHQDIVQNNTFPLTLFEEILLREWLYIIKIGVIVAKWGEAFLNDTEKFSSKNSIE